MKNILIIIISLLSTLPIKTQDLTNDCSFSKDLNLVTRKISCGVLSVPENHNNPKGKQIYLAYLIIKSRTAINKEYPLIYLTGGPGGKALTKSRIESFMRSPFRDNRDIILFDQRGVGYSSALLNMDNEIFQILAKDLSSTEELNEMLKLVTSTKQKIEINGTELSNYNTYQNAKDVGALMTHLGYKKYNILGASYGTTLGRVIQELYPEKLHSVIHNSPSPVDSDFLVARLKSYQLALQRLFNWCETDAQCSKNYSSLALDYVEALTNLKCDPIILHMNNDTFTINAQDGLYFIRRLLYINRSKELVPRLIMALKNRDSNFLSNIVQFEKRNIGNLNFSMFLAMSHYNTNTFSAINSIYKDTSIFPVKMGFFNSFYTSGKNWHKKNIETNTSLKNSDVPTLISVNYYDPVTPPKNGHTIMKKLTNGQLLILDEGGHGRINNQDCLDNTFKRFMDNPKKELDTSCLNLYKN